MKTLRRSKPITDKTWRTQRLYTLAGEMRGGDLPEGKTATFTWRTVSRSVESAIVYARKMAAESYPGCRVRVIAITDESIAAEDEG